MYKDKIYKAHLSFKVILLFCQHQQYRPLKHTMAQRAVITYFYIKIDLGDDTNKSNQLIMF